MNIFQAQYIYTHDALSEYIICGDTSITTKGLRDRMNELSKVSGGESGYQKQLKVRLTSIVLLMLF